MLRGVAAAASVYGSCGLTGRGPPTIPSEGVALGAPAVVVATRTLRPDGPSTASAVASAPAALAFT